ncbi:MAG: antitoxin Xre/MbcA/ParS toxin-binding domain-containing protein [Ferruginibacter sp.]
MKDVDNTTKVYKQYSGYITREESNTLSEPQAIYAKAFDDMIAVSDYDKDFAADLLDISYKTISRYQKENKKLSPLQSEYILKTIVLFNKGNQVFGNKEGFNRWLGKPAFGLGNRIPRAYIITVGGINFIMDELNRIAHGDLS